MLIPCSFTQVEQECSFLLRGCKAKLEGLDDDSLKESKAERPRSRPEMMAKLEKCLPHSTLQQMREVGGWELSSATTSVPSHGSPRRRSEENRHISLRSNSEPQYQYPLRWISMRGFPRVGILNPISTKNGSIQPQTAVLMLSWSDAAHFEMIYNSKRGVASLSSAGS